jgi:hypothetical protein
MKKNNLKIYPKPTAGTGKGITKPNLTHSQVHKGHARSSPKVMEIKNFKMNPNPTADTGKGITKPNLTHSQVNRGSSMLDPHLHS